MATSSKTLSGRRSRRFFIRLLSYVPALLLAAPLLFLVVKSCGLSVDLLEHVTDTLLADALANTTFMLGGVIACSLALAFPAAWLLSRFEFGGGGFWRWSVLMPLALPTYVVAFVWVAWMDYAGTVPTFLRDTLGFGSTQIFAQFRSPLGLLLPMSLSLFPYMYLLIFEGFESQSRHLVDAAKSLGLSVRQVFFKLEVPLLWPWIASGILLVGMESLADFGAVSVFNLNVFTTIVYRSWFGLQSMETASFFALVHVLFLMVFVGVVLALVRRKKYVDPHAGRLQVPRRRLTGVRAILANVYLGLLWIVSFVLPVWQLLLWAARRPETLWDPRLVERALNSFGIAGLAALLAVMLALGLVLGHRFLQTRDIRWAEKISSLGYGIPGTVIAVGWMASITMLWGSLHSVPFAAALALFLGLATRFLALAQRPLMSASSQISHSLEESSQSCGAGLARTLRMVHWPLLKNAFLMAFLFVFIDTLKEMPMTLLMRPFGWDTLAVRVYQYTSDGMWHEAAMPALLIVLASSVPIFLMRRKIR